MANEQNLKPIQKGELTKEEAKKRGRNGGKASGEARKGRKRLSEQLLQMLEKGDTQEKICNALLMQARRGNIKAFEVLRDTIGEKPNDGDSDPPPNTENGMITALQQASEGISLDELDTAEPETDSGNDMVDEG